MSEFDNYDPWQARDCADPDEFFEEHYDDFDCFEDAEEYFLDSSG